MAKSKNNRGSNSFVYSTNPDFSFDEGQEENVILPPPEQFLTITVDTKHRRGKAVTIVEGFVGKTADLDLLGKRLKNNCGTGGSVKDGVIIVQGIHNEKIKNLLREWGFKVK